MEHKNFFEHRLDDAKEKGSIRLSWAELKLQFGAGGKSDTEIWKVAQARCAAEGLHCTQEQSKTSTTVFIQRK